MIPSIEQIVEGVHAGTYTIGQAISWLHQHAEDAGKDLRDEFAAHALQGLCRPPGLHGNNKFVITAERAYQYADAMLKERTP